MQDSFMRPVKNHRCRLGHFSLYSRSQRPIGAGAIHGADGLAARVLVESFGKLCEGNMPGSVDIEAAARGFGAPVYNEIRADVPGSGFEYLSRSRPVGGRPSTLSPPPAGRALRGLPIIRGGCRIGTSAVQGCSFLC